VVCNKDKLEITVSQYEDKAEYQRQWRKLNPDKMKEYERRRDKEKSRERAWERRYGIARQDYENLLEKQGDSCAICKTTNVGRKGHTHFHVDHDHLTGKVRGLLCDLCNRGLGYFKDDAYMLRKAAKYLDG
jgi:hypothetical protein